MTSDAIAERVYIRRQNAGADLAVLKGGGQWQSPIIFSSWVSEVAFLAF